MGRTNPTFRDFLQTFRSQWQPFRRGLRRQDKPHFDRLFEHAESHADAAGYMNATDPEVAIILSMLLAQEREIRELRTQLDEAQR
ncbi:hypothetical protein [Halostella litorea]|uniref:hypothetical protein n=1 Tax=Halostella litorea TaxID=2528831 RepID=UPI001092A67F|nr:hypothetical protein [Halostella litorea]